MIKFSTPKGIATLLTCHRPTIKCSPICKKANSEFAGLDEDDGEFMTINPSYPEQMVKIGKQLPNDTKKKLRQILRDNADVFAFESCRHDRIFMKHCRAQKLNVNPKIPPIRQKNRGMAPDRSKFLSFKVDKLVKVGILHEVKYQTWVANPVFVKKFDGSRRMCIDFKEINKA